MPEGLIQLRNKDMVTKKDIIEFLRDNGIRHDDKVAVHAALRSVGPIEDSADGLIDAMCSYLDKGLLIIPTHTWDEVVRSNPYYDVRTSVPCIGTLSRVAHERNTYLHSVDERLGIPDRLNPDPFVITIKDYDGNEIKSPPFYTHFTAASDCCVSEYYPNYKEALEYTGAVSYGKLGDALVYICDARKMTDTVKMLWEKTDHDLCIRKEEIPREYYVE